MKTSYIGQQAEAAVTNLLEQQGHNIIVRNWRRPKCEIDIISAKDKVIYFTEVKYRSNPAQGDGFDYVNNTKLRQMTYAAEVWCRDNNYTGDCQLLAASVSGANYEDIELIEIN